MYHLNSQYNPMDDLEMNTTLYYVGSVPQHNIPSYTRLDVGLTWHATEAVDLSVVGQNLLDSSHPEFNDPAPFNTEVQRGVYGKLTYRF